MKNHPKRKRKELLPDEMPKAQVWTKMKTKGQVQANQSKLKTTPTRSNKNRKVNRKSDVKQIHGSGSRSRTNVKVSSKKSRNLVKSVNVEQPLKPLALLIRTSPSTMVECVQCLNEDQRETVKEMGFQGLLGIKLLQSPAKLGYYLLDNLDDNALTINTPAGILRLTSQLVHEIFGIPSAGTDIDDLFVLGKESPLVSRWYSQFKSDKMTRGEIVERIKDSGDSGIIFKMNSITLFVHCICKSYPFGFCITKIVHKMAGKSDASSMDWCSYLLNCVRGSKKIGNQTLQGIFMLVQSLS